MTIMTDTRTPITRDLPRREPRTGYDALPLPLWRETPMEYPPDRVLYFGYARGADGRKTKSVFLEVEKGIAGEIRRMDEREKGYNRRLGRCLIRSGKTGRAIMCPFKNACSKCSRKPEEIIGSRRPCSPEYMKESGKEPCGTGSGSAAHMVLRLEASEMLARMGREDRRLTVILTLLSAGMTAKEIMVAMKLSRTTYYALLRKLKALAGDYMDL